MQQRYCSCGYAIWVEYELSNANPQVLFRVKQDIHTDKLTRCPYCGRALSIDELA